MRRNRQEFSFKYTQPSMQGRCEPRFVCSGEQAPQSSFCVQSGLSSLIRPVQAIRSVIRCNIRNECKKYWEQPWNWSETSAGLSWAVRAAHSPSSCAKPTHIGLHSCQTFSLTQNLHTEMSGWDPTSVPPCPFAASSQGTLSSLKDRIQGTVFIHTVQ